jgi:hypothetical protein
MGTCLKKKHTKRQPIFILLNQFRNRKISDAFKLLTDVAFGTDAHTWQERRKVEEIQEEQERGKDERKRKSRSWEVAFLTLACITNL